MSLSLKKSLSIFAIIVIFIVLVFASFKFNLWKQNRIIVDAPSYYTYLPALFIHHDLSLSFIDQNPSFYKDKIWYYKIENDKKLIKHPLGFSLMLSPFFAVGHISAKLTNAPLDGYSWPYQNAITIGVWIYLFIGLWYLRKHLLIYFPEKIVAITLLAIVLATNLFWYSSFESIMPHTVSFALFCVANYYFFQWLSTSSKKQLFIFATCFALSVLIRPLAVSVLLYFVIVAISFKSGIKPFLLFLKSNLVTLTFSFLIALLIGSLQFIYWKYATGKWIYDVYMDEHFIFNSPQIVPFLFSFRKGIFIYTPILIFALIGLISLFRTNKFFFYSITALMGLTVFILSSWWAWSYGISWGIRPMIDYYAFLAFPLAAGFSVFHKTKLQRIILTTLVVIFIGFNLFQTWQYKKGLIHYDDMSREAYFEGLFQTKKSEQWTDLLKPYNWKRRIAGLPQIEYSKQFIEAIPETQAVYFRGYNQLYTSASVQSDYLYTCYYNAVSKEELFYIKRISENTVAIKAANNRFLSVKPLEHDIIVADAVGITETEKFIMTVVSENDNRIRLQTMDKKYLTIGDKFPYIIRSVVNTPGNMETFRLFVIDDYQ